MIIKKTENISKGIKYSDMSIGKTLRPHLRERIGEKGDDKQGGKIRGYVEY